MSRVRVNRYKASKSGRALARYLGVKMIKLRGSRFRGRSNDVVINWGMGNPDVIGNARQINKLENVQLASNKLLTFRKLNQLGVSIPACYHSKSYMHPQKLYMARTTLTGHSGKGIVVGTVEELPEAPLYTEFIPKIAEYRAIVVNGKVVDFKKKKRRRDYDGDYGEYIWNHSSGYIFARNDFTVPPSAGSVAIDAVKALGLDFGAVDIIEDETNKLYVLEVNTAFGIEGTTLELVGEAIKEML